MDYNVFIDGAARGNPGPAGVGIYLTTEKKIVAQYGYFLGNKTNNQAEYVALICALVLLKDQVGAGDSVTVYSDSQLLVRQMNGVYKVKDACLIILKSCAMDLIHALGVMCKFVHVMREKNIHADKLANEGIDKMCKIPPQIAKIMADYKVFDCA